MPGAPLTDDRSRAWFKDAFRQASDFAARRVARPASLEREPPLPSAASVLVDLLARLWADVLERPAQAAASPHSIQTFDALQDRARSLGLEVTADHLDVARLSQPDCPAILLAPDGGGWLALSCDGDRVELRAEDGVVHIGRADLAARASQSIIRIKPIANAFTQSEAEAPAPSSDAKPRDPLRRILTHMTQRHRGLLTKLLVSALFSNLMLLALPIYSGLVFDRVIPHAAFDTLWAVSLGVLVALGVDLAVRYVRLKLQDALASETSATLQGEMTRKLVDVKMLEAPRSAGAVTLQMRELDNLAQLAPQIIAGVFIDAPFLLVVFGLIWLNGGVAVLAPVAGLIVLAVIHHLSETASRPEQVRAMKLMQFRTNQLIETVEGLERVKITRMQRRLAARLARAYDEFAYASHVARLWQTFASYSSVTIGQMMIVAVMVIGAYQISEGAMTIGALSTCTLLVGRVITPMGQLVSMTHRAHQVVASYNALSDGQSGEPERAPNAPAVLPPPRAGAIRLSQVSFQYATQSAPQIDQASLVIRPGEKVGVIGRSGSGKSTLLRMLTRLADPTSGSVLIDDFDARHYDVSDLRAVIGYMSQSPAMVDDTIVANLTLGLDSVDPARLEDVVRLAGLMDLVARHPLGYGMSVGARGERLSGGERQSVALARLLLARPRVLVLDEPTASMDPILEAKLVRELRAEIGDRTLVVATHRASMLELVDRVIWMDAGKIAADGPKAEVLARLSRAA